MEVWGAQGGEAYGDENMTGGYGGYSIGIIYKNAGGVLYIAVGGEGNYAKAKCSYTVKGNGYNGGGYPTCQSNSYWAAGSGGATHIATVPGVLKVLSSYKDTDGVNVSKEILIVAGGGGAANVTSIGNKHSGNGGNGGGIQGNNGTKYTYMYGEGGTQTAGGTSGYCNDPSYYTPLLSEATFGQGALGYADNSRGCNRAAGGGGWYGGGVGGHGGGGGGSGYIGSSNLISGGGITKHMTCYSCTTSSAASTLTYSNTTTPTSTPTADVARIGNGYARITYLGTSI